MSKIPPIFDDQKKIFLSRPSDDFDRLLKIFSHLEEIERHRSGAPRLGEGPSWDAVKEKLKAIIASEEKHQPLSDEQIAAKLKEQGIELARRTVAKYRKIAGIPPARRRKIF